MNCYQFIILAIVILHEFEGDAKICPCID